jgi:hypothetical protein
MAMSISPARLDQSILATVAYADIFDFPLDRLEVHRDLIGVVATEDATFAAIDGLVARGQLAEDAGQLTLPGREAVLALRRERRARAATLWPVARKYGLRIARLPFVRLVAVSGSLAANNPDPRADLDYLIVTVPGRLWLVRAMTILLVRAARLRGIQICPNYLLTTRALVLARHELYTAHELLQIVPLAGDATYRRMLAENGWAAEWLPNRFNQAAAAPALPPTATALARFGEAALGGTFGDRLEAWEGRRKQRRFGSGDHGARFTNDVCEGHYGRVRQHVQDEFARRCAQIGIAMPSTNPAPACAGRGVSPACAGREAAPTATFNDHASIAAGDK